MALFVVYFFLYSFLGWICESIYCLIIDKVWVNRGFLNGPVCPVYGVGSLCVIGFLGGLKTNIALLFIVSVVVTTLVEYITAIILEKSFNLKWWDYSNYKFNFQGRVCLLNSTLFGILSVLLIEVIQPRIFRIIDGISDAQIAFLGIILGTVLIIDFIVTILSLINMTKIMEKLCVIKDEFKLVEVTIDKFNESDFKNTFIKIKDRSNFNELKDKLEEFYSNVRELKDNSAVQKRILRAFPNIKSIKYSKHFKDIKGNLFEYWSRKKR